MLKKGNLDAFFREKCLTKNICASPAEKIECIRDIWPLPGLCFHECRQPVHAGAQVGVAADNVDGFKAGGVIEHPAPP